jgi:hypothetical protein
MDPHKIANYEQQHGAGTFFQFRSFAPEEAHRILQMIKKRMRLPEESDALKVVNAIRKRSSPIEGIDATRDGFDLKRTLERVGFTPSDHLLLNWFRFDQIDEIRTDDLCRNFDDIWYPSSDDLDILESNLNWILSIDHSGAVWMLEFNGNSEATSLNQ